MQLTTAKTAASLPSLDQPPGDTRGDAGLLRGEKREERTFELCEGMIDIAAALFNVSGKDIRRPGRCDSAVTRARQIAMYVAHVALGLSMRDIAPAFNRDRTTVVYACHMIEDMRDDRDFDRVIVMVERVALAAFGNREGA